MNLQGWTLTEGNSKEITYFTGVNARNPSGSTSNIDTVVYKINATVVVTEEFTYDASDRVTKIEGV
jgi:hypothetical protein